MKLKLFFIILAFSLFACKDNNDNSTPSENTIEANRFVYNIMNVYYKWYDEMPRIDYKKENDTEEYFYKLISDNDRFSYISNDAESVTNTLSGIEKTFGYELIFFLMEDKTSIVAAIEYVYADSPAQKVGLKRGDYIYKINGQYINTSNYTDLVYAESLNITCVDASKNSFSANMISEEMTLNPVAEHAIFESGTKKIGYLLYMNYIADFNNDLSQVFKEFKESGVSDIILDLRYNTGGSDYALTHLCSILAPASAVANKSVIVYDEYNDILKLYLGDQSVCMDSDIDVNMNLSNIYIITGNNTYSASEATIIGLMPYMNVTTIGDTTGGKNSGMFIMSPEDFKNEYSSNINNWIIAPIVSIYKNSNDYTFTSSGLRPDYYINEFDLDFAALGSENEPLTAAAIALINGTTPTTTTTRSNPAIRTFHDNSHPNIYTRGRIINK